MNLGAGDHRPEVTASQPTWRPWVRLPANDPDQDRTAAGRLRHWLCPDCFDEVKDHFELRLAT
jgi:hypothetical protein